MSNINGINTINDKVNKANNKMNKATLISQTANKSGLSKEVVSNVLEAFMSTVIQALHEKQEVQLMGFGSFVVASRSAITARNPKTGEPIQVPATSFPKFKPGKLLKEAVK